MRQHKHTDGEPFKACNSICASSLSADRANGLIYGSIRKEDNAVISWEQASIEFGFCAYCGTNEIDVREPVLSHG